MKSTPDSFRWFSKRICERSMACGGKASKVTVNTPETRAFIPFLRTRIFIRRYKFIGLNPPMSKDKESEFYTEKAFTELLAYSDCMTRFASQKPGTAFAAASVLFLSAFSWLPSSGEHLRTNDPTRRSTRTPTA